MSQILSISKSRIEPHEIRDKPKSKVLKPKKQQTLTNFKYMLDREG